jgi:hypothetical protein
MTALLTIFGTVVTGVFVFALGQLFQRLILEPIQEQRKNVARIAEALTVHRATFVFKPAYKDDEKAKAKIDLASDEIRKLAADLRSGHSLILWNDFFACLWLVPSEEKVRLAALYLIRWATFASDEATQRAVQNIAQVLKIKFIEAEDKEFDAIMVEAAKPPAPTSA